LDRIKLSVRNELRELERLRDLSQKRLEESRRHVMDEESKLKLTKSQLQDVKAQIAAREKELRQQGKREEDLNFRLIGNTKFFDCSNRKPNFRFLSNRKEQDF